MFKENEMILESLNSIIKNYLNKKEQCSKQISIITVKEDKLILETLNSLKEDL